jgi:hypothetical protein
MPGNAVRKDKHCHYRKSGFIDIQQNIWKQKTDVNLPKLNMYRQKDFSKAMCLLRKPATGYFQLQQSQSSGKSV